MNNHNGSGPSLHSSQDYYTRYYTATRRINIVGRAWERTLPLPCHVKKLPTSELCKIYIYLPKKKWKRRVKTKKERVIELQKRLISQNSVSNWGMASPLDLGPLAHTSNFLGRYSTKKTSNKFYKLLMPLNTDLPLRKGIRISLFKNMW